VHVTELSCPACGTPSSQLPADHEVMLAEDLNGFHLLVCNYGVPRISYTIETFGSGEGGDQGQ
jgi:hypothetical protein